MKLAMELLSHILAQGEVQITFPQQNEPFTQIVEGQCYQALCKIKAIIEDDRLNDSECFEEIGSGAGSRHDFG